MSLTEAVAGNVKNVARHVGAAASSVGERLSFFQSSGAVVDELKALNRSDEDIRILDKAKDKLSLTIKATPSRDAATMSHMAVKSGFLMKKNEQGNWQTRFVCTVPHLFLYYYDMEKSETPRGIIDLYYYTKMCQVGSEGNVLKLEGQSSAIREFFFQFNDANAMNDWMSDLYNDRYENIRAQRDAYKEMQDNFSGQMNDTARTLETTQRDTERLSIDIAEARQSVDEAKGIVIEAMSQLNLSRETDNLKTCGDRVVSAIEDLQQQLRDTVEANKNEIMRVEAAYEAKLSEYETRLKVESAQRAKIEAALLKSQQQNDDNRVEFLKQLQHMAHNLQLAVVARDVVQSRLEQANEKKKILVTEVKRLRAEAEAADDKMKKMRSFTKQIYDQALTPPKDKNGKPIIKRLYPDSMLPTPSESAANSKRVGDSPRDVIDTETTAVTEGSEHGGSANTTGDSKDEPMNREDEELAQDHGRNHSRTSSTSDADGWDLPPVRLKELGWLSTEQEALVETRVKREQFKAESDLSTARQKQVRTSSFSLSQSSSFFNSQSESNGSGDDQGLSVKLVNSLKASGAAMNSSFKASGAVMNSSFKASGAVVSSVGTKTSNMFSSLLAPSTSESSGLLDSMLSKITPRTNQSGNNTQRENTTPDVEKSKEIDASPNADVNSFFEPPATTASLEEEESQRAAREKEQETTKVACLRCGGSVDGPKNTTCNCRVPALTEADLATVEESSGALESTKKLFGGMIRTLSNHL